MSSHASTSCRTARGALLRSRRRRRLLQLSGVAAALIIVIAMFGLMLGDYALYPAQVVTALLGGDEGMASVVVLEWRLPRVAAAILFGAALGVSGAVFQILTGNPLGSPDVLGTSAGAYTGALLVIVLVSGAGLLQIAAGAFAGGFTVTALVVLLAMKKGGVGTFRFIVVGIAVTLFLGALNTAIVHRASREVALSTMSWGAGSLGKVDAIAVSMTGAAIIFLLAAVAAGSRSLMQLHFGAQIARSTGVHSLRDHLFLLTAGAGLTAVVTAVTGPISFIALAAPQIARRLGPWPVAPLWLSAATGTVLLGVSDLIAQHAFDPVSLPVGVITVSLGGFYLLWLVMREARRR